MKKIIVILVLLLTTFSAKVFSQSTKIKASQVDFFLGTGLVVDYPTGAGTRIIGHLRHINSPFVLLDNPYLGIGITEKAFDVELGVQPNFFDPNKYNDCFRSHCMLGLIWKYRSDFYEGHLVSETFKDPGNMFIAFQIGADIEYRRWGTFLAFHPGIAWTPTKHFKWKDNGSWHYDGEVGIYFLIGFFK